MKPYKKIGITVLTISEIIICTFAIMTLYKVGVNKATISDMDIILLAQSGIVGVVWGSVRVVNHAKNKYQVKKEDEP
jgi:hypothetical protein